MALAMALQEGTAEDSYRRLEETLQKARSLSIKYQLDLAIAGANQTASGTLLLKEGNRVKITLSSEGPGTRKLEASVVSDGSTVRSLPLPPGSAGTDWAAPKDLKEATLVAYLRAGCMDLHRLPHRMHDFEKDPKASLLVSQLRRGEDEAGLSTLTYTLQEGSGQGQVKIWFDPKTWMLRKRVMTVQAGDRNPQGTVTETYEPAVNPELSDDLFKLTGK